MSRRLVRWAVLAVVLFTIVIGPVDPPFISSDPLSAVLAPKAAAQEPAAMTAQAMPDAFDATPIPTPTMVSSLVPADEPPVACTPLPTDGPASDSCSSNAATPEPIATPVESSPGPVGPAAIPGTTVQAVIETSGGRIASSDGDVTIDFPTGAAPERLAVSVTKLNHYAERLGPGKQFVGIWNLEAFASDRGMAAVKSFSADLDVNLKFSKAELSGLNPESLELWTRPDSNSPWTPVPAKIDPEARSLSFGLNHFSQVGATASGLIDLAPSMANYTVGLQTGAATVNIPIEVPEGLGGLTPNLALDYDSTRTDGMKSYDSLGSWVGVGWDLTVGSVTKSANPFEGDLPPDQVRGGYSRTPSRCRVPPESWYRTRVILTSGTRISTNT